MSYDFVVIGSGISGLTTATILAQNGRRVALLEKAPLLAPVLRGFRRQGILFDTGFHYAGGLEEGGVLDRFFRYLGVAERLEKYPFAVDRFDIFRDTEGKGEFRFPVGFEPIREALCSAFPEERKVVDEYLEGVKAACGRFPYLNPDIGFGEQGGMETLNGPSLAEFLDRLTGNAALKSLLSLHTLLYGVPSEEVSFSFHAGVVGGYYQSVHGLKGGGLSLVQAFQARLKELGIDLFTGREAKGIRVSPDGKVAGVETDDGEVLACGGCVATVHPRVFLDLVPPKLLRPAYCRRLTELEETVSGFILYGVCESPVPLLQGANLFLGRLSALPRGLVRGELEERIFYLTGTAAEGNGPAGRGFVAICPADQTDVARWGDSSRGRRPKDYLRFKDEIMERMQRHIEDCCPELRGRFQVAAAATPLTMRDFAANPKGGLYGAKHRVGQFNPQSATRVPGLFLAGQAVAAPGILGGVMSGFMTCGHILGHDRLFKGVKECS